MSSTAADALTTGELTLQKQQLLLEFYNTAWNEMTWRRNAGYRTIILGFAYFGILLTQREWTEPAPPPVCRDFWTAAYAAVD